MITLDNLFTFFEFIAEENTYIQHQPGTTGTTNRFSRFSTETTTGQLSKLGYPRLEVVQLPFGLITDFNSSQQETLTARVRVIYKLSDKFDFDEEVTALDNAKKALFQMLNYIQTAQDECPGNSLLCAFDMNSVRYTFLDKATFSGSAVGCELSINFKKGICWEEVAYGDFPGYNGTIALPTDDGDYVLNVNNGVYSWQINTGGAEVITKTQAQFLALVSGSTLQFPAVYKITDIKNGLFVETLSANTFKPEATLSFLAPDYTLHGQYHTTDGAVANGSIVTWGGFYWENTSGGSSTPNVPDEATLDNTGDFTQISKSVANGYVPILLNVIVDTSLDIVKATDEYNNSIEIKSDAFTYLTVTIDNYQWNLSATGFYNNQAFISNNVLTSGGKLISNQTVGGTFIKRNKIDATSGISKNSGLGIDFQVSEINNCIVSNVGFISQNELHLSYIKDTNVDGGGSGAGIDECHLTNLSFIDGCSIFGSDCYFASCWFDRESGLQNVTINTNNTAINCVELYDQTIIENFTLPSGGQVRSYVSNHSVDLTGFSKAFSQNNENGCGSFTEEIDFGASNLASGSSLLLNLIPNGARLTMLSASGTLTGTNIEIGLETDDEAIISGAVGLLPLEWSGASIAATANRSLKIKATGGDITAGVLTVKVEFVV